MPTVDCPECGERFSVFETDELRGDGQSSHSVSTRLDVTLESWSSAEPRHPYSGANKTDQAEITRDIQRIHATITMGGETRHFDLYQKPEDESHFWTHVVRTTTDAGQKSKNAVPTVGGELYVKNRGVPWNEEKQWTYLSKEQLARRGRIAGLGDLIHLPESDGGLGLLLDETDRPLVVDESIQEDLVCKLAKSLLVFQSTANPTEESVTVE